MVFVCCLLVAIVCDGRWRAVALVFACAAAVAASCAWRSAALESSPLRVWASHRASVTMAAVVTSEPRSFQRFGSTSALVRLDAQRTTAGGITLSGHAPVLAIVPD